MSKEIEEYNRALGDSEQVVANTLAALINDNLKVSENKLWHGHPVWFIEGNPIVGYSKLKAGIKLLFWSGADFGEAKLEPGSGKFKDASMLYTNVEQINEAEVKRWLEKSEKIQWDYKNIVKRKGKLVRLK